MKNQFQKDCIALVAKACPQCRGGGRFEPSEPGYIYDATPACSKCGGSGYRDDERLCEPEWIPIDEFMKDPVKGLCWITNGGIVYPCPSWKILDNNTHIGITITHAQPIRKPKMPE